MLHRDKDETFDTLGTWVPVEPPTQDSATVFMATNGAGAGLVGGALLATMVAWPIAVIAAGVGAVLGGATGAMLGAGTFKSEETRQLVEQYHDKIARGVTLVAGVSRPRLEATVRALCAFPTRPTHTEPLPRAPRGAVKPARNRGLACEWGRGTTLPHNPRMSDCLEAGVVW